MLRPLIRPLSLLGLIALTGVWGLSYFVDQWVNLRSGNHLASIGLDNGQITLMAWRRTEMDDKRPMGWQLRPHEQRTRLREAFDYASDFGYVPIWGASDGYYAFPLWPLVFLAAIPLIPWRRMRFPRPKGFEVIACPPAQARTNPFDKSVA